MILIDTIPAQIQVPKHSTETVGLSFSLFGNENEVFTTNNVTIDGLHYAVLIDKVIKEGNYRY